MEISELANRVDQFSTVLLVGPSTAAIAAGFLTMGLLALGGILARRH